MNIEKQARRDAREYARAQMFYGEGAGTRRKLIAATVDAKTHKSQAYGRAFYEELSRQDMAEHASKARRERHIKDVTAATGKNLKGLATGNYQSVQTGILVVVVAGYVAHQTGLDRKLYEKGRQYVQDVRTRLRRKKADKNFTILS